jgi:NADH:ubiquinone oxidoreductase subunit 6 (subunit J)
MLFLTALGYFSYIGLTALIQEKSLQTILKASPYTSVMLIVVSLNVLVGYFLWLCEAFALQNKTNVTLIFLPLAIIQLFLGNIIVFATSLLTYLNAKDSTSASKWAWNKERLAMIAVIGLYGLCLVLILMISLNS